VPDVISNSSPLQYLYQADVLDLLPVLFGQVCVPEAVVAELEEGRRRSVPLPTLADLSWLQVRTVRNRTLLPLVTHLGDGEKEVLALGRELSDALLLLDDRDARRHAHALQLEISGTLGVLLLAKERGILDAVRPVLDRLQALRFRLDVRTRQSVLELAGEVT
jgi:predicted nucleic acid-binding protein